MDERPRLFWRRLRGVTAWGSRDEYQPARYWKAARVAFRPPAEKVKVPFALCASVWFAVGYAGDCREIHALRPGACCGSFACRAPRRSLPPTPSVSTNPWRHGGPSTKPPGLRAAMRAATASMRAPASRECPAIGRAAGLFGTPSGFRAITCSRSPRSSRSTALSDFPERLDASHRTRILSRDLRKEDGDNRVLFSFQLDGPSCRSASRRGYVECDAPSIRRSSSMAPGITCAARSMGGFSASTSMEGNRKPRASRLDSRPGCGSRCIGRRTAASASGAHG